MPRTDSADFFVKRVHVHVHFKIDFPENALKVLTEVERMAPISVSPEGSYVLYGERYEYLYDVERNGWIQLSE